jgi:hypothetical protein
MPNAPAHSEACRRRREGIALSAVGIDDRLGWP